MSFQRNQNIPWEDPLIQKGLHETLKGFFPFCSMGRMVGSKGCKSQVMRHFMNVSEQKLKRIEIRIDGDGLGFLISAKTEISQLGASGCFDMKMKRVLLPKQHAIWNRSGG